MQSPHCEVAGLELNPQPSCLAVRRQCCTTVLPAMQTVLVFLFFCNSSLGLEWKYEQEGLWGSLSCILLIIWHLTVASIQSFYHCPLQFSSSFISSYFLLTVLVSSNSSCSTYIIFLNPFPLQLLLFHLFKVPFVSSFRLLAPATSDISSHNLFGESQVFFLPSSSLILVASQTQFMKH